MAPLIKPALLLSRLHIFGKMAVEIGGAMTGSGKLRLVILNNMPTGRDLQK